MTTFDKILYHLHFSHAIRSRAARDAAKGVYQPQDHITALLGPVDETPTAAPTDPTQRIIEAVDRPAERPGVNAPELPLHSRWRVAAWVLLLVELQAWVYAFKSVNLEAVGRLSLALGLTVASAFLAHFLLRVEQEAELLSPLRRLAALTALASLTCVAVIVRYKAQAMHTQSFILAVALAVGVAAAATASALAAAACWHRASELEKAFKVTCNTKPPERVKAIRMSETRGAVAPQRRKRTRREELAVRLRAAYDAEYRVRRGLPLSSEIVVR